MPITIITPKPIVRRRFEIGEVDKESNSSSDGEDFDGDVSMPPAKRARSSKDEIVTPGEVITDDPQWMRCVGLLRSVGALCKQKLQAC